MRLVIDIHERYENRGIGWRTSIRLYESCMRWGVANREGRDRVEDFPYILEMRACEAMQSLAAS